MENTTNTNAAQNATNDLTESGVLAATYQLLHKDDDGEPYYLELNGEETVTTTCPVCGKQHTISLYDFCAAMANDGEIFGTTIFCAECAAKRAAICTAERAVKVVTECAAKAATEAIHTDITADIETLAAVLVKKLTEFASNIDTDCESSSEMLRDITETLKTLQNIYMSA